MEEMFPKHHMAGRVKGRQYVNNSETPVTERINISPSWVTAGNSVTTLMSSFLIFKLIGIITAALPPSQGCCEEIIRCVKIT